MSLLLGAAGLIPPDPGEETEQVLAAFCAQAQLAGVVMTLDDWLRLSELERGAWVRARVALTGTPAAAAPGPEVAAAVKGPPHFAPSEDDRRFGPALEAIAKQLVQGAA